MTKHAIAKSILFSLTSPLLTGLLIGTYYALTVNHGSLQLLLSISLSAISNAHVVGLSMAFCVLPCYLFFSKRHKITYSLIVTSAMLGGACFSYLLSAQSGPIFLVNTLMASFAGGIFLWSLRKLNQPKNDK